jgi:2-haloacid dehalogenase
MAVAGGGNAALDKLEVLFFDVLGTVVDWRGSIAEEAGRFPARHGAAGIDASAFADAWVGGYDAAVDPIRRGQRAFVPLDVLNRENLGACLERFGMTLAAVPETELELLNTA